MTTTERPAVLAEATTAHELVSVAAARLREAETPSPRLDAELLVGHAFGRDRAWLHAHPEAPLPPREVEELMGWVMRRAAGEPIAYLRGFKEWLSLRIITDRRALIPRPETELLAETAMAEIAARMVEQQGKVNAWEVATGGGAVALALALRFRSAPTLDRLTLVASDISADALELASENLAAHGVAGLVTLACGDLLEPAAVGGPRPDVLIANLPYLTSEEASAGTGSLAWEPLIALDGGADGLDLLRRLVTALPGTLAAGGTALLEVGEGQAATVRTLLAESLPGATTSTLVDLAGIDRVLVIRLGSNA